LPPLTSLARVAVFFDGVSADGASMTGLALSTGSGLGGVLITGVNSAMSPLVLGCNLLVGFIFAAAGVVLADVLTEFLADVLADVLTGGLLAFLVGVLVVLVVFVGVVLVVFVVVFVGVVLVVLGLVIVVAAVAAKDKDKFNDTIAIVNADRVSTRGSGCG
jgi:hypothetical protein